MFDFALGFAMLVRCGADRAQRDMPQRMLSAPPTQGKTPVANIQTFLRGLVAAAFFLPGLAPAVAQQPYPNRPVRLLVPFAPGGTSDVFARITADKLSQRLNQQFYVENVPGASGNIGTGQIAKAAPDGHSLLIAFSSFIINPSLFASVPYDPLKDFEPIMLGVTGTHVVTVTPSVPAKSMSELLALIRATPKKYNFAHGGAGTPGHLLGEQFRISQSLDIVPVPFNGAGPAIASVIGGHTPIGITALAPASPQIAAGALRALAVTSKQRTRFLPDVPTTAEAGLPDLVGDLWVGVMAPARTPPDIIATLNREFAAVLAIPDTRERLAAVGFESVAGTPDAFRAQLTTELGFWRKVIEGAKIKAQ